MLLFVLTLWHFLILPSFGLLIFGISFLAYRFSPPPLPPQFILDMERIELLAGRENVAAEVAVKQLMQEAPPTIENILSSPSRINNKVYDEYNEYKDAAMNQNMNSMTFGNWLKIVYPALYNNVYGND